MFSKYSVKNPPRYLSKKYRNYWWALLSLLLFVGAVILTAMSVFWTIPVLVPLIAITAIAALLFYCVLKSNMNTTLRSILLVTLALTIAISTGGIALVFLPGLINLLGLHGISGSIFIASEKLGRIVEGISALIFNFSIIALVKKFCQYCFSGGDQNKKYWFEKKKFLFCVAVLGVLISLLFPPLTFIPGIVISAYSLKCIVAIGVAVIFPQCFLLASLIVNKCKNYYAYKREYYDYRPPHPCDSKRQNNQHKNVKIFGNRLEMPDKDEDIAYNFKSDSNKFKLNRSRDSIRESHNSLSLKRDSSPKKRSHQQQSSRSFDDIFNELNKKGQQSNPLPIHNLNENESYNSTSDDNDKEALFSDYGSQESDEKHPFLKHSDDAKTKTVSAKKRASSLHDVMIENSFHSSSSIEPIPDSQSSSEDSSLQNWCCHIL